MQSVLRNGEWVEIRSRIEMGGPFYTVGCHKCGYKDPFCTYCNASNHCDEGKHKECRGIFNTDRPCCCDCHNDPMPPYPSASEVLALEEI
jgi:hypothetical protein